MILKNRNGPGLRAFRNDGPVPGGRRIEVRLQGRESNRDAVGARVWVETERRTLMREVVSGAGFLSQRSRRPGFGLAADESVRKLRVRWPAGTVQEFPDVTAAGLLSIVEGRRSSGARGNSPGPRGGLRSLHRGGEHGDGVGRTGSGAGRSAWSLSTGGLHWKTWSARRRC